jgi:AraC-like DNA-binding protein
MSGLTESHFIRAFHHDFGLPPHAYHMRLRLAEASRLLARGQSVSTVAFDCGFADQSHLSRKFREVYGVAPGAWASVAGDSIPRLRRNDGHFVPGSLMHRERVRRQHAEKWLS